MLGNVIADSSFDGFSYNKSLNMVNFVIQKLTIWVSFCIDKVSFKVKVFNFAIVLTLQLGDR